MPVDLSGTWQRVSTEGLEEFLRSIGAPEEKINQALTSKPKLIIKQTGDNDFTVTSELFKDTQTYKIGTPFQSKLGEEELTTVAKWDGNKLVLTSKSKKRPGKEQVVTREIVGGKLVQKLTHTGGPVATDTFEKA